MSHGICEWCRYLTLSNQYQNPFEWSTHQNNFLSKFVSEHHCIILTKLGLTHSQGFGYLTAINPSLVKGGRKVVTPNFQILIALKWNIWWFQTCCKLGHIITLCILGHQKISKFSLYLSYSTCDEVNKIFLPN